MASKYTYDPSENKDYLYYDSKIKETESNTPTYANTYGADVDKYYNEYLNREDFSYDLNEDALYQQYKDQYTRQGKMAMMDTMGQAAALTGGYGNSYASTVGNQAYQGYLQELNNIVPELQAQAYDRYVQEGQDLYNQFSAAKAMEADEYNRYMNEIDQHWQNLSYLTGQRDSSYEKGYANWQTELQLRREDQQNAYSKLSSLIATGYEPSASELSAAGMTKSEYAAMRNAYAASGSGDAYDMTLEEWQIFDDYVTDENWEAADYFLTYLSSKGLSESVHEELATRIPRGYYNLPYYEDVADAAKSDNLALWYEKNGLYDTYEMFY